MLHLKRLKFIFIFIISSNINSENILEIYNEALENDPTYKAAEYSYLADKQIVVQGRAALLPSITLSGSTNWNEYYQNDVLQQEYNSFSKSARISQPLLRLDTWFNFKRSKSLTNAAEADFAYQQQNLLLRTAELYFGVLRAIDNLNAAISEEKAIKKQLDQAQQRFEVGLSAITGVQEAQLAFDLSKASRINSEGNLFSAREALNALIGREIFSLDELGEGLSVSSPFPNSKEEWVKTALDTPPGTDIKPVMWNGTLVKEVASIDETGAYQATSFIDQACIPALINKVAASKLQYTVVTSDPGGSSNRGSFTDTRQTTETQTQSFSDPTYSSTSTPSGSATAQATYYLSLANPA